MHSIKPHHFVDIIKLYGGGREHFVPAPAFGHSFYLLANLIVSDPGTALRLTLHDDEICATCKYRGSDGICQDTITHIRDITSKDAYNKLLDQRILDEVDLREGSSLTAYEFCVRLCAEHDLIRKVWLEDLPTIDQRQELFLARAEKYIRQWKAEWLRTDK